jgi:hypothetical protein
MVCFCRLFWKENITINYKLNVIYNPVVKKNDNLPKIKATTKKVWFYFFCNTKFHSENLFRQN